MIIAYSELGRANPARAYEVFRGLYAELSRREDMGLDFRFFPRLLCGMVFSCSSGRIPQPECEVSRWKGLLERMLREGRGKEKDVKNALACLAGIPLEATQQAL